MMNTRLRCAALALLVAFADLSRLVADNPSRADADSTAQVADLIRQLSSEQQALRDRAQRELSKRPGALLALRQALKSDDAEIVRRAGQIVTDLLVSKIKTEGIDLFLERFARVQGEMEIDVHWSAFLSVCGDLIQEEKRRFGIVRTEMMLAAGDIVGWKRERRYQLIDRPSEDFTVESQRLLVRARNISCPAPNAGVYFASGQFRTKECAKSIVFSGETIECRGAIVGSIVICDGDVVARAMGDAIVIARGSVESRGKPGTLLVVCTGAFKRGDRTPWSAGTVKDNSADLLGLIKFFEVADAGLEVAKTDSGITVTKVAERQLPQKAGVRTLDVIIAIDDTAAKDVEQFRRLLRKAVAKESAKLRIRRDGKEMELTVSYANWSPPPKPAAK
jgi:hypothetical protein